MAVDRSLVKQHLAQVEHHITGSERHIARQREVILELERQGHNTAHARYLLARFEELQGLHIADRNRLREELQAVQS